MVFTEAHAGASWMLSLDTGFQGRTLESYVSRNGFELPQPQPPGVRTGGLPKELSAYLQHWLDHRGPPPGSGFAPRFGTTDRGPIIVHGGHGDYVPDCDVHVRLNDETTPTPQR